jgi:hypothetical protein
VNWIYLWICINTNNKKIAHWVYSVMWNVDTSKIVYRLQPTSDHNPIPSTHHSLTHGWLHSYTLYSSHVNPRLLVNSSPQIWLIPWSLDQGSCMNLIPYLYNKQKHCIILFCFLRRTDQSWDLSNALNEYS